MIYSHPSAVPVITWFFEVLALAALVFEAYALIDALRRPRQAYIAASKQTKPLWLVITGVATVIGLWTAFSGSFTPVNFLSIAAFVAAAIYLTDVRPKVKEFRSGGSGTRMGPYGPW